LFKKEKKFKEKEKSACRNVIFYGRYVANAIFASR
jgi:hypothetical protein